MSSCVTCRFAGSSVFSRVGRERFRIRDAAVASKTRRVRMSAAASRRRSSMRVPTCGAWENRSIRKCRSYQRGTVRVVLIPTSSSVVGSIPCSGSAVSFPGFDADVTGRAGGFLPYRDGDHADPRFGLPLLREKRVHQRAAQGQCRRARLPPVATPTGRNRDLPLSPRVCGENLVPEVRVPSTGQRHPPAASPAAGPDRQ